MNKKKIILLIISICLLLCINPIKRYYRFRQSENFYQERGLEYSIIQCPECGRDAIDSEHNKYDFCQNCGTPLFEADEQMLEMLDKVEKNLEPTKSEKVLRIVKKIILYSIIVFINYNVLKLILKGIEVLLKKLMKFFSVFVGKI